MTTAESNTTLKRLALFVLSALRSLALFGRQDFLANAGARSPSVVVLDQVESVCRRRPEAAGITELQVWQTGRTMIRKAVERVDQTRARFTFGKATCNASVLTIETAAMTLYFFRCQSRTPSFRPHARTHTRPICS